MKRLLSRLAVLVCTASLAQAQLTVPGADGSDLDFNPTASVQIDLGEATTAAWNTPSPVPKKGVYDPIKWAVVYKYANVTIGPGITVTFVNHPSGAPVVWLVSGSVTINGTIWIDGGDAVDAPDSAQPGPGGFAGGRGNFSNLAPGSAGFGPGGGQYNGPLTSTAGAGGFRTIGSGTSGPVYGNTRLVPLVGGSGGSPWFANFGCGNYWIQPGAGGGAILIACAHSISVAGVIRANGSAGTYYCGSTYGASGAGGGIRLVADSVTGIGALRAVDSTVGIHGGLGCIRVEANFQSLADPGVPAWTFGLPGATAVLWPEDLSSSRYVRLVSIAGKPVPADPRIGMNFGIEDVRVVAVANPTSVVLETMNVDTNSATVHVRLRVVRKNGKDDKYDAVFQGGNKALATWVATLDLPPDITVLEGLVETP